MQTMGPSAAARQASGPTSATARKAISNKLICKLSGIMQNLGYNSVMSVKTGPEIVSNCKT